MRLWSLHPKYLDVAGLLGLWRESLLAKKVLSGHTSGYKNHPQLNRFKNSCDSFVSINFFLRIIYEEALFRGYNFNISKVDMTYDFLNLKTIPVTLGQVLFERKHLINKLFIRDKVYYSILNNINTPIVHPIFHVIEGEIERWEKI